MGSLRFELRYQRISKSFYPFQVKDELSLTPKDRPSYPTSPNGNVKNIWLIKTFGFNKIFELDL